MSLLGYLLTA